MILAISVQDVKKELIKRAGSMKKAMEEVKSTPQIVEISKKQLYIPPSEGLVKEHVLDGDWTDDLPSFVEEIIDTSVKK